jgi:hypothetical protein
VGSLPDIQEGSYGGQDRLAATIRNLDEQLAVMRRYGQTDVILVSSALTPEQVAWAADNGVEARESRLPRPGMLYLVNREGIDLGIDGDA